MVGYEVTQSKFLPLSHSSSNTSLVAIVQRKMPQMSAATRAAWLNPKRKRRYSRKPTYRKRSRASLVEGGVNGGHAIMIPNVLPPVQEVKYSTEVGTATQTSNEGFNIINGTILAGIIQGTGPTDRIGRNIRVVGVVVRALVNTDLSSSTTTNFAPSTIDLVWDNQCNGSLALVADIYANPTFGASLPNPLFDKRFKFAKRMQVKQPSGSLNLVDYSYTCNKLVEYKASTGTSGSIADLSSSNLYLIASTPGDAASKIEYSLRVLYVDA